MVQSERDNGYRVPSTVQDTVPIALAQKGGSGNLILSMARYVYSTAHAREDFKVGNLNLFLSSARAL